MCNAAKAHYERQFNEHPGTNLVIKIQEIGRGVEIEKYLKDHPLVPMIIASHSQLHSAIATLETPPHWHTAKMILLPKTTVKVVPVE